LPHTHKKEQKGARPWGKHQKTSAKPQKCVMTVKRSCSREANACKLAKMAQMHTDTENTSCL
jgi:hypothetical protein